MAVTSTRGSYKCKEMLEFSSIVKSYGAPISTAQQPIVPGSYQMGQSTYRLFAWSWTVLLVSIAGLKKGA